jgi:hypothetical protein
LTIYADFILLLAIRFVEVFLVVDLSFDGISLRYTKLFHLERKKGLKKTKKLDEYQGEK